MNKNQRPQPRFKIGDSVYLFGSRKGLGLNNCVFGIVKKIRYRFGYSYQVAFKVKLPNGEKRATKLLWLTANRLRLQSEHNTYILYRRISELSTFKKQLRGAQLAYRNQKLCEQIEEYQKTILQIRDIISTLKSKRMKVKQDLKKILKH